MRLYFIFPLFFLALLNCDINAVSRSTVDDSLQKDDGGIIAAIKALENDPEMAGAQWGFCAYNLSKQKYVAEKNRYLRLVPASVLKIFTTISIFDIAGYKSTFQTKLYYDGKITQEGLLKGDLIIHGNGDPTVGCDYFGNQVSSETVFGFFKTSLEKGGIHSIEGNISGDASLWGFMLQPPGYLWEDIGNYYGAGIASLNYNENKLKVTFQPGKAPGDSAQLLSVTSHPLPLKWLNLVSTASSGSGDNVFIYGSQFQTNRLLTGTVPAGKPEFSVWASDPDPALRFAGEFMNYLTSSGFTITGTAVSEYQNKRVLKDSLMLLCEYHSPTFKEISKLVNHKSHNVCAESFFRYIGMKLGGSASWIEIPALLNGYWKKKGIQTDNQIITDGSGLSRTNMITTGFLVDILVYATKQTWFNDFFEILPVAGKDGTLKTVFTGTSAENNLRGKSGMLKGVRSYTGYVQNKSGDTIAFAVIVNGHNLSNASIRKKIENLVVSLSDSY